MLINAEIKVLRSTTTNHTLKVGDQIYTNDGAGTIKRFELEIEGNLIKVKVVLQYTNATKQSNVTVPLEEVVRK